VDDMKKTYREAEETAKENWRKADGEEDLADKVGNVGDDIRKEAGNAGDDLREGIDDAKDEVKDETDRRY
jgi:gas vesicle protein